MIGVTSARVQDYLGELDRALRDLPRDRRREMMRDISQHIDSALVGDSSPAAVENVIAALGSPDEIAAAVYAELPPRKQNMSTRDVLAIILLLVGGLVLPVVGWIIGLILLWTSNTWGVRDKIIGTVLVPGGLLLPLLGAGFSFALSSGSGSGCTSVAPVGPGGVVQQGTLQCTGGSGGGLTIGNILVIVLLAISILGPIFSAIWLIITARRSAVYRAAFQAA